MPMETDAIEFAATLTVIGFSLSCFIPHDERTVFFSVYEDSKPNPYLPK
jgi:hypothetical protein